MVPARHTIARRETGQGDELDGDGADRVRDHLATDLDAGSASEENTGRTPACLRKDPMTTDTRDLYRRASDAFGANVHRVRADQWGQPTPCTEWDVRTLVNHVVGENRWAVPLFAGGTVDEVGDRFDGDLLGDDPVTAWDDSAREALAAVDEPGAMDRTVHLSFGDFPGREYAMQLFADLLVHGWDLARATAQKELLEPELVAACAGWFADMAQPYRDAGAVAQRPSVPGDADAQTVLLADFGRAAVPAT